MPKLYSSKEIERVLKQLGFVIVSQKGSHVKYKSKSKPELMVIVPEHGKEIPHGTLRSILRQAKMDVSDLNKK